ncbi:hypothetical protein AOC36_02100 [Erysipelothrix larvae]|uniref:Bacterial repeat domain-containing protein n=1 Tax=Erysipelothrix larvae TaxID=1514105 RepID=A0A109UGN0_9FIRM|nr:InlB B-repeat-containing protein [Erysipelothrix larvae]AMC92818.1 hypothetical protein AOC36_02100 [Erysipelothrix larvae]
MRNYECKTKKILLILSISCALLILNGATIHADIGRNSRTNYSFFRSLNAGNTVTLTSNTASQTGAIFASETLNLNFDFDLSFAVNLGNQPDGGEGIAFILHNDRRGRNATGDGGECLGVYQCSSTGTFIENSLALEFDTHYNNTDIHDFGVSDISVNNTVNSSKTGHIAITIPSKKTTNHYNVQFSPTNILADGKTRTVNVRWNAQTKQLIYTVEGFGQQIHSLSDYQSIFNGDNVYWGFSGATSSKTNTQSVSMIKTPTQNPTLNAYTSADNGATWSQNLSLNPSNSFTVKLDVRLPQSDNNPVITIPTHNALELLNASSNDTSVSLSSNKQSVSLGPLSAGRLVTVLLTYRVKSSVNNGILSYSLGSGTSNNIMISAQDLYALTYDANGGSNQPIEPNQFVSGALVSIKPPGQMTHGNLTFTGWNTRADGSGTSYMPGAQISLNTPTTLYAQWSAQTAKLTIYWNHPNSETDVSTFNLNKAQTITLQSFLQKLEGSTLTHFNTAKDGSGTEYRLSDQLRIIQDTTLYAQWTQRHLITITFDPGMHGKLASLPTYELYSGETLTQIPNVDVIDESVVFKGWAYEDRLLDLNTYQFTQDTTLNAVYTIGGLSLSVGESHANLLTNQLISVTFDCGEHGTIEYETFLYPKDHLLTSRPYVTPHEGYAFIGWFIDDTPIDVETYRVQEPIVLVAKYDTTSQNSDQSINNDLIHIQNSQTTQQIAMKVLVILVAAALLIFAIRTDILHSKKHKKGA